MNEEFKDELDKNWGEMPKDWRTGYENGYDYAIEHICKKIDEFFHKHYGEELKNEHYFELKKRITGEEND